jgi:hypothetical protein
MLLARFLILTLLSHTALRDALPAARARLASPPEAQVATAEPELDQDEAPPADSEPPSPADEDEDFPEVDPTSADALCGAVALVPSFAPVLSSCTWEPSSSPVRSAPQIYSLKRLRI